MNPPLDCIIIGHNDTDFRELVQRAQLTKDVSGFHAELCANSVVLDGDRLTYMGLADRAFSAASGSPQNLDVFGQPNLAVFYLASFLKRRGHRIEVVNLFNRERQRLLDLLAMSPSTVAITTTFQVENEPISEVVQFVKEHAPDTRVIVGGPHVFNLCSDYDERTQDFILESLGADIFVNDAQGEVTLERVVRACQNRENSDLSMIPNLIVREEAQRFRRSARQAEVNDLDANVIDWSLFESSTFTPMASMRTARSCPFSCAFCNYPTMAGTHTLASIETLVAEMRALNKAGVRYLSFIDDTFNVPLPRFKVLLREMIANRFDFQWISFFRCSNSDDEAIALMREAGCVGVLLGIESGDQNVLNAMNKSARVERYVEGIQKLNNHGIATFASLIIGHPGETEASLLNTLAFLEEAAPTFFTTLLYYHDKRSPIARRADEFGICGAGYSWSHATMDWKEAASWLDAFLSKVRASTPMPLYGFSLWGVFYLLKLGLDIDRVRSFGQAAQPMLVASSKKRDTPEGAFENVVSAFCSPSNPLEGHGRQTPQ